MDAFSFSAAESDLSWKFDTCIPVRVRQGATLHDYALDAGGDPGLTPRKDAYGTTSSRSRDPCPLPTMLARAPLPRISAGSLASSPTDVAAEAFTGDVSVAVVWATGAVVRAAGLVVERARRERGARATVDASHPIRARRRRRAAALLLVRLAFHGHSKCPLRGVVGQSS